MFAKVLLASDGSEEALAAARSAAILAKKFDASLTILNVYAPASQALPASSAPGLNADARREQAQDVIVGETGRTVDQAGVHYVARKEIGHPAETIIGVAEEDGADLIVLGSRGLGDVKRFLLGSVADRVAHHAHCPVLIVRGRGDVAEDDLFRHILLASDGSACALEAAAVAAILADKLTSRVTIINVFQPSPYVAPYGEPIGYCLDDRYIAEIQDDAICSTGHVLDEHGVAFRSRKEIGPPAAEIARVAEEEACDLIVLGSRGLGGFQRLLLGSVSDGVAHHAHCPVLIVR